MAVFLFFFGIAAIVAAVSFLISLVGEDVGDNDIFGKKPKLKASVILLLGVFLAVTPFILNTKTLIDTREIIAKDLTVKEQPITFGSPMVIQWDEYKADHWWTWSALNITRDSKFNIRIRKAQPSDLEG